MPEFYFFKHDGMCKFMSYELNTSMQRYVMEPHDYEGVKYYLVLEWNAITGEHILEVFKALNIRYVKTLEDLPPGAGAIATSYDGNQEQIADLKHRQIPVLERVCPWINKLKLEILKNDNHYQYVLLIKDTHIVYRNYKSILPEHTIILDPGNYRERLKAVIPGKPLFFLPYATMRKTDFDEISHYISSHYPHPGNRYEAKTLCGWITKQGILEEISTAVKEKKLDQVWIICNGPGDTSTLSMIKQADECGVSAVLITDVKDIPAQIEASLRIGCAIAPVPFPGAAKIKEYIKTKFPTWI